MATNIHALFFHDHPDNGKGFRANLLAGLLPGATGKMSAIFSDTEPGIHHIYVKVLGKSGELDFEDNVVSLDIRVLGSAEGSGSGGCNTGTGTGWGSSLVTGLLLLSLVKAGKVLRKQNQ